MEPSYRLWVGLPVYNGENYLEEAIEAILAQTYTRFGLLISDNASTDSTPDIIKRHAEADSRITAIRHDRNLGAAPNYNAVYREAPPSEFYCWVAHDDLPYPDFFQVCIETLDANPAAVVAVPGMPIIDAEGNAIDHKPRRPRLTSAVPHVRYADAIDQHQSNTAVFGMMRRAALDRTRLHGSYIGSDRTLLAEMTLQGPFVETAEDLLAIREHPEKSTRRFSRAPQRRDEWFDTARAGKITFPKWKRFGIYLAVIPGAPIPLTEKVKSCGAVARWLTVQGNWKPLVRELLNAAGAAFGKLRARLR